MPGISGHIFVGPGQKSLCSLYPAGTFLIVRAIATDESFIGTATPACPANDFSIPLDPGSYWLRVNLPLDQPRGQLPQRWLELQPVEVGGAEVIKDVHVRNGLPLGGGATLDGSPLPGVQISPSYSDVAAHLVSAFGVSGSTGAWQDAFFDSPMILQGGISWNASSGCQVGPSAGIREIRATPAGPAVFPTEFDRVDCEFFSGDGLRYTHRATRLKLTSYPGDIGGLSDPVIFPDLGYGYSAQFPLPAGQSPRAGPDLLNRQLFTGGLVLGVGADVALAGAELQGYIACSVSPCRAFGFDGQASVTELAGGRRDIAWSYTDAGSQRPMGLEVSQHSFDGQNGGDYVLYAFRITNRASTTLTITPGVFLDFDVSPQFSANIGYTELGGRLMITTSQGDVGAHFGHLIVNGPRVPRTYFFTGNQFPQESEFVAAIRGELSNEAVSDPSDVRGVQGGNTVKLGRGKATELWVAVVAGDDRAQTVANAQAAIADATARIQRGNTFSAFAGAMTRVRSVGSQAQSPHLRPSGPICKAGCGLD
ncbi:MAG: hypothetical protein ACJ8BF_06510 [Gemmatimonadales bacterium]